jgi:hypothetical protein
MKVKSLLSALALLVAALLFTFCNKEPQIPTTTATPTKTVVESRIDYYKNLVKEYQNAGKSAFFQVDGGNWVENPSETWLTEFVKKQPDAVTERTTDLYTIEVRPLTGAAFNSMAVNIGACGSFSSSSCLTSGNVYISGVIPCPTTCPSISASVSGSSGCNTAGTCKFTIHRVTPSDCACYDLVRTLNTPFTQPVVKLGTYCCTINYCW